MLRVTATAGRGGLGFYTDWFLADPSDAEAVASIATSEEQSFKDWPHLPLKDVGEMELSALWAILRGEPDQLDSTIGNLLFQDGDEVFVCCVEPGFVNALAAVKPTAVKRLAADWSKTKWLKGWGSAEVERAVRELVKFAGRARREAKPVIQLSVV
jgi:hypothetical protein